MSDTIKWAVGLTATVVLAVVASAWVIASEIGELRIEIAVLDARLTNVEEDVRWLRNNASSEDR